MTEFGRTAVRPAHRGERTQWDKTRKRIARHRKLLAFFEETRWLRLGGGVLVGVYGAFGLFSTALAVAGIVFGLAGAAFVLAIGLACFVVAGFGIWVYRSGT